MTNTNIQSAASAANATHTPGPWSSDGVFILGPSGVPGVAVPVARANTSLHTKEQTSANARLIAAAPELLEVARLSVEWADQAPAPYRDWAFIIQARAAIAKATNTR